MHIIIQYMYLYYYIVYVCILSYSICMYIIIQYIYVYYYTVYVYILLYTICIYLPTPLQMVGYVTRSVFKWSLTGLNSKFSYSETDCLTMVREPNLPNYLPIAGRKVTGFISFPSLLVLCEMQFASSRIWNVVALSIFYDDNYYTTRPSVIFVKLPMYVRVWHIAFFIAGTRCRTVAHTCLAVPKMLWALLALP